LIGARFIQGIGGAMMLPTSLSLLNSTFFGKDRGIAFAVWGSTIGAAAAFGPLLGGWLTTSFSWRWAFGINIPLGILIIAGLFAFVQESRSPEEERGADLMGAFLSVIGIGSIVFGLIEGRNYGWFSSLQSVDLIGFTWDYPISIVPVAFLLGAGMLALFIKVEVDRNRQGKAVLLDLRLLAIPSFRNANIAAAIVSLGEFGLLFALPLWLQNVLGYSAFETGLILLSLALGSFMASGAGAALGNSKGSVFVVRTGIVLEILGIAMSGLVIAIDTSWWLIAVPLFVYGAGVGLATAQLTGVALADVPVEYSGQGSGITSTTRQLGSALGIAILGTVLFSTLGNDFSQRLESFPQIPVEVRSELTNTVVQSAGAVIPGFLADPQNQAVGVAAAEALTYGTKLAAFIGAAFLVLGWLATRRLRSKAPTE
jgi:EmrB/QacA subfamily drug resistance transporter